MYGRIGEDWNPKKLVRALRLRFSNAATMGDYDEIILALGGKESTNPPKTFSTPVDNPVPLDVTHPVLSLLGVEGARGSGDAARGVRASS